MSDLYPTPTRLALLADVDAGRVFRDDWGDSYIDADRKVNARVVELANAGLVALRPAGPYGGFHYPRWQLTDAGRAVLDQHRRADHA